MCYVGFLHGFLDMFNVYGVSQYSVFNVKDPSSRWFWSRMPVLRKAVHSVGRLQGFGVCGRGDRAKLGLGPGELLSYILNKLKP